MGLNTWVEKLQNTKQCFIISFLKKQKQTKNKKNSVGSLMSIIPASLDGFVDGDDRNKLTSK